MPIQFTCPHCGKTSLVADEYAGQSGPCSACGAKISIPNLGDSSGGARTKSSSGIPAVAIAVVALVGFIFCCGIGTALLLPAVQASREAARRMSCSNNLKQIAIAMHNYHDVYKTMPPAYTVDENGNKLHSWRTLILPFLEQQALYEQIDLSKPWDDPVNRRFANTAISAYRCPSAPGDPAATSYMAIVGPNTILQGDKSARFADITDGTSNTLMVVEVRGKTNKWMEPVDLDYAQMKMTINGGDTEISSYHPGGAQVAIGDGSVRFLSEVMDGESLRAAITRNGGETVRLD